MRARFLPQWRVVCWCVGLFWLAGCTDAYLPQEIKAPPSYLVVDGLINPVGITTIKLSRSYAISSPSPPPAETKATVYVEAENGPRYTLREAPVGTYTSAALTLNPAQKYRLHLTTQTGKEYASDYVPVKLTPPIDNIKLTYDNGLGIFVNAHDDTRRTQYYRWETTETWEIIPPYQATVEYVKGGTIRDIVVPFPTICYGNSPSFTILIDKTMALSQDVVANFRLRQLPTTSERLNTRYSMLVQQHALTKEEYAYWELLRKNTESIGTLFDPQPAQLTGNVHCLSNPGDVALGFVGTHSVTDKRIFIARADLPRNWRVLTGYEKCVPPDTVFLYKPSPPPPIKETLQAAFAEQLILPINPVYDYSTMSVYAYTVKPRDCVDCRTRGSAVKPSFW